MQNPQTISPLACGIIGCANGYQHSSYGVDKELNIAYNYLDLPSNVGDVLPDPAKFDSSPLFCLAQFSEREYSVLTLSEYHSVKQKGSNRSGTFLGAFIETVNCQFSLSEISAAFQVLKELCGFQYQHFIDHQDNRYIEEIKDKPFPKPSATEKLEATLTPWKALKPQGESLYIACPSEAYFERAVQFIFESGLLRDFQKIYFSASREISEGFKQTRIKVFEPEFSLFEQQLCERLNQREQQYMQMIQKSQQSERMAKQELQQMQNDQEKIIAQELHKRTQHYIDKTQQAEKELAAMQQYLESIKPLNELGKTVLEEVGKRAKSLENINLARFSSSTPNLVEDKLFSIENRITDVANKLRQFEQPQQVEVVQESSNNRLVTWILIVISGLSLVLAIWGWCNVWLSDNVSKKSYDELKTNLSIHKRDAEEANSKLEKTNKSLADFKQDVLSLSKTCQKNTKDKELCDKLSDVLNGK
ncbi:hypothetical protein Q7526_11045 [Glaesserella parasuis]|nr:hypothetical protein [Glaesserella parasuis]MDO9961318.1 hypothetical protein [Glaesserella parasuis]MDP0342243.1 hypothetical protein [Glaesserella parasuis]MDP0358089.1 hypothetical protein [Glaesserella parasuis]